MEKKEFHQEWYKYSMIIRKCLYKFIHVCFVYIFNAKKKKKRKEDWKLVKNEKMNRAQFYLSNSALEPAKILLINLCFRTSKNFTYQSLLQNQPKFYLWNSLESANILLINLYFKTSQNFTIKLCSRTCLYFTYQTLL